MIRIYKPVYQILIKNYLLIVVIFLTSCNHSNHTNQKPKELEDLIGTWVIDSATFFWNKNKFFKLPKYEQLTFHNDTDYTLETRHGCIVDVFKGNYYILNNHKRRLKTIAFVPDIEIFYGDTNRLEYDNFDIVKITSHSLQIVRATEFINTDSLHYYFSRKEIYKKIK